MPLLFEVSGFRQECFEREHGLTLGASPDTKHERPEFRRKFCQRVFCAEELVMNNHDMLTHLQSTLLLRLLHRPLHDHCSSTVEGEVIPSSLS